MSGADVILLNLRSDYRVLELGTAEHRNMAIRRVNYDVEGRPLKYAPTGPKIEGADGDALLLLLNDIAEALTKPSLLLEDFE